MEEEELRLQQEEWAKAETPEHPLYEPWDPSELGVDIPDEGLEKLKELPEVDGFDEDGMDYNA